MWIIRDLNELVIVINAKVKLYFKRKGRKRCGEDHDNRENGKMSNIGTRKDIKGCLVYKDKRY